MDLGERTELGPGVPSPGITLLDRAATPPNCAWLKRQEKAESLRNMTERSVKPSVSTATGAHVLLLFMVCFVSELTDWFPVSGENTQQ